MGVFDKIFKNNKQPKVVDGYFKMLNGYTPVFSTFDGGVYEMELTRACINVFASHCSKLCPSVSGADLRGIQKILDSKPNFMMTSAQFLYKVATIYETQNTCFIVPILDKFGSIVGYYPCTPQQTEIVSCNGEAWLRYTFGNGQKAAMEMSKVGIVSKFLYKNDVMGESNRCLLPTMQLLDIQRQGIAEGIKNSASFRFMASVNNFIKADDLKKERERFVKENLGSDSGGLALFPNTYTNVQQITSNPQIVDSQQMTIIEDRVYNYFGISKEVLQNKCVGDQWSAYYEGKIEPFAIQLSQAMTSMTFTSFEQSRNNCIVYSANRLQYLSTQDKLNMSSQMFDRGILTINQIMDIWNLPHIDGEEGNKRYIRKEYIEIDELSETDKLKSIIEAQKLSNNIEKIEEDNPDQADNEQETEE